MQKMIVIDTSVAAKWFLKDEAGSQKAKEILTNHFLGTDQIIVPEFLFYEIANTLATKSAISSWKITHSLTKIFQMRLNIYHLFEADLKEATRLTRKYKTSVYDMLYAVVARKNKAILVTADGQFIKQTGFKFVKLL